MLTALAFVAVFAAFGPAASPESPVRAPAPEASQFDFLIGAWDIVSEPNLPGVPERVRGRWTARKSADGYMVVDEYRVFDDDGATVYLGETYRVFNPSAKRWGHPPRSLLVDFGTLARRRQDLDEGRSHRGDEDEVALQGRQARK